MPIKRTMESELCALRLSAPALFRACVPRQGSKDSPQAVGNGRDSSRSAPCPLRVDTGSPFRIRLAQFWSKELAEKAVRLSGCRALFATIVAKGIAQEPIRWIDRDRNVSDENYYRFSLSQAEVQGKPLIFRNGGGRSLGMLGADDALDTPRLRTWVVHGAPKSWDQNDLVSFLKENSWDQPAVITRRKSWSKGSPPEWLFRAFAPTGASDDVHFAYADEASYVTVVPEGPRAKNKLKSSPVSGPTSTLTSIRPAQKGFMRISVLQDHSAAPRACKRAGSGPAPQLRTPSPRAHDFRRGLLIQTATSKFFRSLALRGIVIVVEST